MKARFVAAAAALALLSACASTGSEESAFSTTSAARETTIGNEARDRVFFGFDKAKLSQESVDVLKAQAQYLKENANKTVMIEGHTDDRGTREYNIGLGERRANAVRNYLITQGVDPSRIDTISYGKERPAVIGANEDAWAQNRRAVTVINAD